MQRTRVLAAILAAAALAAVLALPAGARQGTQPLQPQPEGVPPGAAPVGGSGPMFTPPAAPKESTVDELIAELVALKAREAKLVAQLREKLKKQRDGLEKLKKAGVSVDVEQPRDVEAVKGAKADPAPVDPLIRAK